MVYYVSNETDDDATAEEIAAFVEPVHSEKDISDKNTNDEDLTDFITVMLLGSGYAAVQFTYSHLEGTDPNNLNNGFWEPWDTGFSRHPDRESAINEAKAWSVTEQIRLVLPNV